MKTKQVIVIRKDLKMRRGKEIAQGCHSSQDWILSKLQEHEDGSIDSDLPSFTKEEINWLRTGTKKVCLQINSEKELDELYWKAKRMELTVHMVIDGGKTEFNQPTKTAICIGPHEESLIDAITGSLKLY